MAAQGTNEGGSKKDRAEKSQGSGRGNYYSQRSGGGGGQHRSEAKDRRDRSTDKRDSQSYGGRERRGDGKPGGANGYQSRPYDKSRSYGSMPRFAGKDDDEDTGVRRSRPSRPKESKSGTSIPDKNKAMLRLEKEQKSMQKKKNKKKESSRPQPRQKRSNNINYTKNYANGAYDDYEDYYD